MSVIDRSICVAMRSKGFLPQQLCKSPLHQQHFAYSKVTRFCHLVDKYNDCKATSSSMGKQVIRISLIPSPFEKMLANVATCQQIVYIDSKDISQYSAQYLWPQKARCDVAASLFSSSEHSG